jgi:hypothetical protein
MPDGMLVDSSGHMMEAQGSMGDPGAGLGPAGGYGQAMGGGQRVAQVRGGWRVVRRGDWEERDGREGGCRSIGGSAGCPA